MACNSYILGVKLKDVPGGRANLFLQNRKFINDVLMTSRSDLDLLHRSGISDKDIFHLPCGSCAACRLKYSRDWAVRIELEMQRYKYNYFVTTTYDDFSLPSGNYVYFKNGEKQSASSSLVLKHPQNFIKRFRSLLSREFDHTGVRVFYCGEYGDLNSRPHYHYILMNCPDLSSSFWLYKRNVDFDVYVSDIIDRCWDYKGYSTITDANYFTAAYTARYVFKKQKGRDLQELQRYQLSDDEQSRVNPFCHMSNRPGIAGGISEDELRKIYDNSSVYYHKKDQIFSSFPPRYFDKLFEEISPEDYAKVKDDRACSRALMSNVKNYSEDLESRLHRQEDILLRREKKMIRKLY